jgi:hypothetical protein
VLTDYGQSISRVLQKMDDATHRLCGQRRLSRVRVIAIYLNRVQEESRALDGTHICASASHYSLLLLCCVVEITFLSAGMPLHRRLKIKRHSESIVTALAGLQSLTSTFLPLVGEVL